MKYNAVDCYKEIIKGLGFLPSNSNRPSNRQAEHYDAWNSQNIRTTPGTAETRLAYKIVILFAHREKQNIGKLYGLHMTFHSYSRSHLLHNVL